MSAAPKPAKENGGRQQRTTEQRQEVSVYFPQDVYDSLCSQARRAGLALSAYIVLLVRREGST